MIAETIDATPKTDGSEAEPIAAVQSSKAKARELVVDAEYSGQRLDNFVMAAARDVPRTRVYRGLRKGEIRVNKSRCRPDYRIRVGDIVRLPPWAQTRLSGSAPAGHAQRLHASRLAGVLAQQVLFEDQGLIVLNKPFGIAVHGGSGLSMGVIEALRSDRTGGGRLELIHRLDRETSGCLMIAKRRSALAAVHAALRDGLVRKTYVLLVKGRWRAESLRTRVSCDATLARSLSRSGERIVRADPRGQPALTHFKCLRTGPNASLLLARPITGRTHQIRVHASLLGYPIAGDQKYGDRDFNHQLKQHEQIRGSLRMCLHAAALDLPAPAGSSRIKVEAPLDEPMSTVLKVFGFTDVLTRGRTVELGRTPSQN